MIYEQEWQLNLVITKLHENKIDSLVTQQEFSQKLDQIWQKWRPLSKKAIPKNIIF